MFKIKKYQPKKENEKEETALDKLRKVQEKSRPASLMTNTANNVYLVIDMSISMEGEKFLLAKSGAMNFSRDAISKGWRVGLVAFHESADMMCELTTNESKLASAISKLHVRGSTNMSAGLDCAIQYLRQEQGRRYIVLVTDGWANDPRDTQNRGDIAKSEGIEIITLGTPDALEEFLQQLASSDQLSSIVKDEQLQIGMTEVAGLLPCHEY